MASKRKKYHRAHRSSIRLIDKSDEELELEARLTACIKAKMLEADCIPLDKKSIEIISRAVSTKHLHINHRYRHKHRKRNYAPERQGIKHGERE